MSTLKRSTSGSGLDRVHERSMRVVQSSRIDLSKSEMRCDEGRLHAADADSLGNPSLHKEHVLRTAAACNVVDQIKRPMVGSVSR